MPTAGMTFCLNLLPDEPIDEVRRWWRACDEAGVDAIGVADSPIIVPELGVTAATCALTTSRSTVMTAVTNAVSRDPSVMASILYSLDQLAPGRVACGIATGDSAMWSVGLKRARIAELREYILAVRSLLDGEEADFRGRRFRAAWKGWTPPARIPIYVACSGPKTLRMAAQTADGMIVFVGFSEENLAFVDHHVREACAEVGRDPSELTIYWQTTLNFGDTVEEAMSRSLGVNTSWMTLGGLGGKQVPEHLHEPLKRFNADMEEVGTTYAGSDRGRALVERAKALGLYDWIISIAPGFWGPPEVIADRLRYFRERGMTHWQFYVSDMHGTRPEFIEKFTQGVLPALERAGSTA